jgi:hypothetical protein
MKLTQLTIHDFLGVQRCEIPLTDAMLFCGDNGAGKSSIQHALRLALMRDIPRVDLKKEFAMLINSGASSAKVEVIDEDGTIYSVAIHPGALGIQKHQEPVPMALKFALDMHLFTSLTATEKRAALFEMDSEFDYLQVTKELVHEHGCDQECVLELVPVLRHSFDSAYEYVEQRLRELRSQWKSITGDQYGVRIAEDWRPKGEAEQVKTLQKRIKLRKKSQENLVSLEREMATQAARRDQQQEVIDNIKTGGCAAHIHFCPECNTELVLTTGKKLLRLKDYKAESLKTSMMAAEMDMAEIESAIGIIQMDIDREREVVEEANAAERVLAELTEDGTDKAARATVVHERIKKWLVVRDLVSPDGLPAKLIKPVIAMTNKLLLSAAEASGWPLVVLHEDMRVTFDNRPFALCSESEQWRADAMLSFAFAYVSDTMLVTLDRMDVLSLPNRSAFMAFADEMIRAGMQLLVFATLKTKPELENFTTYWLQHGELQ